MILRCDSWRAKHDVSRLEPGARLECACGARLRVPGGRRDPRKVLLGVAIVLALPFLPILCIEDHYGGCDCDSPRAKSREAFVYLETIRLLEEAYWEEHGVFVSAGPTPSKVPGRLMPFVPDEGFHALAWDPGAVHHQYEVRLTGPGAAVVIARGDADGNGVVAEYRLQLDASRPGSRRVQALDPASTEKGRPDDHRLPEVPGTP